MFITNKIFCFSPYVLAVSLLKTTFLEWQNLKIELPHAPDSML